MPTSSLTFVDSFYDDIAEGIHTFGSDTLRVAFCSSSNAPTASDSVLLDLTTASSANITDTSLSVTSSTQTGGTYSLVIADKTLTSSGGSTGPFQYVVIYNDTPTTPKADPLIGWYDYGSEITLADGEDLVIDFGANMFTIS